MSVMLIEKPVHLRVDERRLLKNLPAFFSSFTDCLAELIQNAYRAGAANVTIFLDMDERVLRFTDDGCGSTDPQAFLTAGRTGWDESVVTDPAGLGFFSLLGLCDQVIVQSRADGHCGWQMCVTPDAFSGAEVPWDPIAAHFGPAPHGTAIEAKIGKQADLGCHYYRWENAIRRFRHFFPLEVTMTVVERGQTYSPNTALIPLDGEAISTPVGRLLLKKHEQLPHLGGGIIWEYRYAGGYLLGPLQERIKQMPGGVPIASMLEYQPIYWIVDERCGVRPKLPDRNELVQDAALSAAFDLLAASLYEAFAIEKVRAALASLNLPDVVERYHHQRVSVALEPLLHPFFRVKTQELLELGGYTVCPLPTYDGVEIQEEEEDYYRVRFPSDGSQMVRNPLRTGCRVLAATLNLAGCWTAVDPQGPQEIEIRVEGLQVAEVSGFGFGTCSRIGVFVAGALHQELDELYLNEVTLPVVDEAGEGVQGCCYLMGTDDPGALKRALYDLSQGEGPLYGFALYCLDEANSLNDYIPAGSDGCVNETVLYYSALAAWMELFQPERSAAHARYSEIVALNEELRRETHGLRDLAWKAGALAEKYPEIAEAASICEKLKAVLRLQIESERWDPECQNEAVPE